MATSPPETVVTTVGRAVGEHRRELGWLASIALTVFAGVSLAGRDPSDPTWLRPDVTGEAEVANLAGWLGANVADLLYRLLGVGSGVVVLVLLGVSVLRLAGRPLGAWWRWLAAAVAGVLTLAGVAASVAVEPETEGMEILHPAGVLGTGLEGALEGALGPVGFWAVLTLAWLAALGVVFRVSWRDVSDAAVSRVEAELPRVRDAARAAGGSMGAWIKAGLQGAWTVLVSFLVAVGRAVLATGSRAGVGMGQLGRGMWDALSKREEALDDPAWVSRVQSGGRSAVGGFAGPFEGDDDPRGDTQVRPETDPAPPTAPDAEVGWDPTAAATRAGEDPDDLLDLFPEFSTRPGVRRPAATARRAPRAVPSASPRIQGPPVQVPVEDATAPSDPSVASVASVVDVPVAAPAVAVPAPAPAPAPAPVPAPARITTDPTPLDPEDAPVVRVAPADVPAPDARAEAHRPRVEAAEGLRDLPAPDDGRAVADRPSLYFELPPLNLLDPVPEQRAEFDEDEMAELAEAVETALANFKVTGRVTNVRVGPVVTTFEFLPDAGISVRKVSNLTDDLAMAMAARSVRVLAPIPGKGVVGIEVPNDTRMTIFLREMLASKDFRKAKGALPVVIGKDVEGRPVISDLAKMPHLLIGGTTGSGKSVGINVLLLSMLFTKTPDELKLLLIDPKQLEFSAYADIPHLLHPVVKKSDDAAVVLDWACREMDRRYQLMSQWNARNISNFNNKLERELRDWTRDKAWKYAPDDWAGDGPPPPPEPMPYIVIVIDELADLMMVAKKEVETSIVRLAQLARACGMHLVVATQRPSVDVVTGLIKSNMPTRIAFQLRSVTDSRTVLDAGGADKLLGKGDMLMLPNDGGDLRRMHGPFVEDDEVLRVVEFLKKQREPAYVAEIGQAAEAGGLDSLEGDGDLDDLYDDAVRLVCEKGKASTSMIQRHLKIGYNRAARIIDQMEMHGVVGPADGARPREVLG